MCVIHIPKISQEREGKGRSLTREGSREREEEGEIEGNAEGRLQRGMVEMRSGNCRLK